MLISVYARRAALAAGLAFILTACGSGNPDAPAAAGTDTASSSASEGPASDAPPRADGPVNSLSIAVTGDETPQPVPPATELSMVGGCDGKSIASIGLYAGDMSGNGWFQVSFETDEPIGKGQTGSFALSRLEWDNGLSPVEGMPEGSNITAPNRFEGTGRLELKTHDTGMNTRRMVGTLSGHLTNTKTGKEVDITIDTDFNWSCGVDLS